ncbi:MAG TPA: hypothetical protein PKG54_07745 [Phycisphaerae bacterium]|nr:hypothetical protein [Phycisphaerae bacterium]HOB74403.1 hypothetical protein [Phycisphaerae bacterium]HOJ54478.1 hypothetical protein [Phycisphaerae bacterium]HOL26507.1 hypothetical protein [Phycisphaerae bacterium]HPP20906.1 hypothetical protein [Phycisphaerae bacterium]
MSNHDLPSAPRGATNPLMRLLDTVGSIWFGVILLVLIFIYASIGSAVPPIRQGAMADWLGLEFLRFEKSEMEWFSWWPFVTLVAVFCLSIVVVTLRRIPLTLTSAGVWAIHLGIVLMAVACAHYFGSKVEGDAVVFQALARIRVAGGPETTMVIRPEASVVAGQGSRQYRIQVSRLEPDFVPDSGPNKGRRTQRIWLNVTSMDPPRSFIRKMLVGDPSATEDTIAATGERTLDTDLQIVLDYDPARYFYHSHEIPVRSNGAIYARFSPDQDWTQLRVDWLPHYYEWLTHQGELWPTPGEPLPPPRVLNQPVRKPAGASWLDGIEMRVTDYLPYADMEARYVEGTEADPLNPVLRFRLGSDGVSQELAALNPSLNRVSLVRGFTVEFAWAATAEEHAALIKRPEPRIQVRVPSKNLQRELKVDALQGAGPVAVEGTDYRIELREVLGSGQMSVHSSAMVLLRVTRGDTTFDRIVIAGDNSGGRDMDRLTEQSAVADPDILFDYLEPARTGLLLVGRPDSETIDAVLTPHGGDYRHLQARIGEPLSVFPAMPLMIESLMKHARQEVRPVILPRVQRQSLGREGKRASLVRVEINDGRRIQGVWLRFNEYAFPDAQRAQPRRYNYAPRTVQLADGRRLQLMYSRQRELLPSPVALDHFELKTYPGGDHESDFISRVSFQNKDGSWSKLTEIRSNQPARHGDYWYFQSRWDPGTECHTVLGVGNRKGVHAMLAGVCISIAGMVYAFYVKPVLIRRRKQATLAAAGGRRPVPAGSGGNGDTRHAAEEPPKAETLR